VNQLFKTSYNTSVVCETKESWFNAWNCCIKTINNSGSYFPLLIWSPILKCIDSHSVRQANERWFSIIRLRRVSGDNKSTIPEWDFKGGWWTNLTAELLDGCGRKRPFASPKISLLSPFVTSLSHDARRIRFIVPRSQISLCQTWYILSRKRDRVFFLLWSICDLESLLKQAWLSYQVFLY